MLWGLDVGLLGCERASLVHEAQQMLPTSSTIMQ